MPTRGPDHGESKSQRDEIARSRDRSPPSCRTARDGARPLDAHRDQRPRRPYVSLTEQNRPGGSGSGLGDELFLADEAVHDPEAANIRDNLTQRDEDVVPRGVGCLVDIGGARIGRRVGVRVKDADDG